MHFNMVNTTYKPTHSERIERSKKRIKELIKRNVELEKLLKR